MLKIRFLRTGKQHQPYFKIVVTDKDNPPRGGDFKAEVGNYNPRSKEAELDEEKIKHWLEEGAQPSGRVHNLLIGEGVIEGEKASVHAPGEEKEETEEKEEEQGVEEGQDEEDQKEKKEESDDEEETEEEEKA